MRRRFESKLEALNALRALTDAAARREQLRRALGERNNFLVANAATLAAELREQDLVPDLLQAFDRFLLDAVRSDPQCLAKTAIARALRDLGHRDPEVFVRGVRHVQFEPTWGGRADTAAELRGTCSLALVTTSLGDLDILSHLADGLADPDRTVRIEASRAIEQLGREEGALLLRLKLLVGDAEPEVVGHCFRAYLSLGQPQAVSFVARFLQLQLQVQLQLQPHSASEDMQLEAASALAESRDPRAIDVLTDFWRQARLSTPFRQALLLNLGASPVRAAADFLLDVVQREPIDLAASGLTALAASRFRREVRAQVAAAAEARDSSQLQVLFESHFTAAESD